MIDRLFYSTVIVATCALSALMVSEALVGSSRVGSATPAATAVVELPRVVISAPREPVQLPRVEISAPRQPATDLADAAETGAAPRRVQ